MIQNVNCHSTELRLQDCDYHSSKFRTYCRHVGGVRCRAFKNINIITITNSVFVTWEYYSILSHQPSSFDVHCINERNSFTGSVSNGTFRVNVGDLLPLASYNCCVSAKYGTSIAEIACTSIRSEDLFAPRTEMLISSDSNMRANIVGGALGFIIVILILLLVICAGALLYLLRSRGVIPKR